MKCYEVSITIEVHDEAALLRHVRSMLVEKGISEKEAARVDVPEALRLVVDHGENRPPGMQILDSACERRD